MTDPQTTLRFKAYSAWFSPRMRLLSATGMAFFFEGINE